METHDMRSLEFTDEASTRMGATHQTAATQFVQADDVRFAYRRYGATSPIPLVALQHFRGNLDNWDPALTDALPRERDVVLVDYPGTGSSSGAFGPSISQTARRMIAFLAALDLAQIDLLGFSIGGFVAQEIALIRPTAGPGRNRSERGARHARLARRHRGRRTCGEQAGEPALHHVRAHRHKP